MIFIFSYDYFKEDCYNVYNELFIPLSKFSGMVIPLYFEHLIHAIYAMFNQLIVKSKSYRNFDYQETLKLYIYFHHGNYYCRKYHYGN